MNGTGFSGTGQRLTEIGALLAQALMRLQIRQSSAFVADSGESSLHFTPDQSGEGWILVRDRYDDGGFSGGTLERPALKRLRADIEAGKVDVVVVYKIDRLSRSLMDFSRLVEVFDQHKVTFVSVTQSFNTTTSMGRLTLNVLLSFAQFEREVIGERIRDKFAASRKRGMWMGGWAPLGYEVRDRKLMVNEVDAKLVRSIFQRFLKTGSATALARELIKEMSAINTASWSIRAFSTRCSTIPFISAWLYTRASPTPANMSGSSIVRFGTEFRPASRKAHASELLLHGHKRPPC
jgi:DNA invertase Pin-like site-specific DNA recombinase